RHVVVYHYSLLVCRCRHALPIHIALLATSFHTFFFNDRACTGVYTLSLHDALPISGFRIIEGNHRYRDASNGLLEGTQRLFCERSEEHTSELQSRENLVCRLLLDKKHLSLDCRL